MKFCLVCDDHALMRTALAGTMKLVWPEITVEMAKDFETAEAAARSGPDFILCDLMMPGAGPIEGVRAVKAAAPDARFAVITGTEDDQLLLALFALGIDGFIPKNASAEIVEAAIRLIAAGGQYLPSRVIDLTGAGAPARANGHFASPAPRLTDRQSEILGMIAQGHSNKEIARSLALSPATVKVHVAAVIALLNASNRTEAVFRGREAGLV